MVELLTDEESDALIEATTIACVDALLEIRHKGGGPADIMTALTRINLGTMVYVLAHGRSSSTPGGVIREMASMLKREVPEMLQKYRQATDEVGTA